MKKAIVVLCGVAGLALTVGAQASMPGHLARASDGTAGVAARIQRLEDLEAVRAIPACYGYGHDLIFKHLGGDQTEAINALRRCHVNALTTNVFLFDATTGTTTLVSHKSGATNTAGSTRPEEMRESAYSSSSSKSKEARVPEDEVSRWRASNTARCALRRSSRPIWERTST